MSSVRFLPKRSTCSTPLSRRQHDQLPHCTVHLRGSMNCQRWVDVAKLHSVAAFFANASPGSFSPCQTMLRAGVINTPLSAGRSISTPDQRSQKRAALHPLYSISITGTPEVTPPYKNLDLAKSCSTVQYTLIPVETCRGNRD